MTPPTGNAASHRPSRPAAVRLVEPNDHVAAAVLGELHRLDHDRRVVHGHQRLDGVRAVRPPAAAG